MYQIGSFGGFLKSRRERMRSRLLWQSVGRNVFFLGLTSLLTDISAEMVSTTLPLYLIFELRLAPLQFGIIEGLYQGAAALVQIVSGILSDRWRRPKVVAGAGYAFSAVCKVGLLIVGGNWLALTGVVVLDRLGKGIRTAPRDSLIAASVPPVHLGTAFGVHRAMDTAGAMLGPLVAAGLLALTPHAYDTVFVVSLCLALIGLAVIVLLVKNPPPALEMTAAPPVSWRTVGRLLSRPDFRTLVVIGSGLALMTLSDSFIYLSLRRRYNFSAGAFPLMYVVTALVFMVCAIPVGRLADRVGRKRVFMAGYSMLVIVYCALLLPGLPWAAGLVVVPLLGVYYAATDGVLMAHASEMLPESSRTTGLAVLITGISLARLMAASTYGAIWGWWGAEVATGTFLAGLTLTLVLVLIALSRMDKRM